MRMSIVVEVAVIAVVELSIMDRVAVVDAVVVFGVEAITVKVLEALLVRPQ